jgi:hypothetical protein
VGVTVWGLDDFEEIQDGDDPLIFEPDDCYYRECMPDEANGWHLSIYAFPKNVVPPLRFRKGEAVLEVVLERLNGPLVSIVQLKVIYLPGEAVFLGLFVNRVITNFPSKSGWTLNGPGDWTTNRRGYVLHGTYPRLGIPVQGKGSLDRTPSEGSTNETAK